MRYKDLRGYLSLLEDTGLLKRIKAEVDLKHEIGAIASRSLALRGPALMFENIRGYGLKLVTNIMSTPHMLALAFECEESEIYEKAVEGMTRPIQPRIFTDGPCKDEIHMGDQIDLDEFPTPIWHEKDGGRYLGTCGGCITRDPDTGSLNMGSYRLMIKGKRLLSIAPSPGQDISKHIRVNESREQSTPLAVAMGMDPLLTFASGAKMPSEKIRDAEFAAAGSWRGEPVELVKCETNDLYVPRMAEIILEGEILCGERTHEGPHGESHGFYGETDDAFLFQVNCVTHRTEPISYGLICAPVEDYPRELMTSGSMHAKLRAAGLKNVRKVRMPDIGSGYMFCIVAADIEEPSEPRRIMEAVWANATHATRWVVVADVDTDTHNWEDIIWRMCTAVMPDQDIVIGPRTLKSQHDPLSEHYEVSSTIGIDATTKFKGVKFPPINKVSNELLDHIKSRWKELGLS